MTGLTVALHIILTVGRYLFGIPDAVFIAIERIAAIGIVGIKIAYSSAVGGLSST
jgi:hypothetical protein